MKNINFIQSLPNKYKKSVTLWVRISLILSCILISAISVISINQLLELKILKDEQNKLRLSVASFNTVMQHKQTLKKQEETLKEQLYFINQIKHQTAYYAILIADIKKSLKNGSSLQSIILEPANIQVCIDCPQTQHASDIIGLLGKLPSIEGLHINSLQPKQHGAVTALRLNLRGAIKPS